ncbi:MAG: LTA synthase family protein [Phycisphaerales bacterium]|nr:LTA synthase family protein [Phycisphaerales bacterium]
MPRPETMVLLLALLLTIGAKLVLVYRSNPPAILSAWGRVAISDIVLTGIVLGLFRILYYFRPGRWVARGVLLVAVVIFIWSILNAAWMIATGVQLQPGVLAVIFRNPWDFLPIVLTHLVHKLHLVLPTVALALACACWCAYRLLRPVAIVEPRTIHVRHMAVTVPMIVGLMVLEGLLPQPASFRLKAEILGFSSHYHAVRSLIDGRSAARENGSSNRRLHHVGERSVQLPLRAPVDDPNIVLVLMESIAYQATSLCNPDLPTTPTLARLASEGVQFTSTRVPVSHTTKAFWAVLTGTTPDIQPDFAEAVPAPQPYEGLPSLLARRGYRSAFFQMSKGTFECAPGLFSNLVFDWAWFRENLQDPSANLGYLAGDDLRMIEPAFAWAERESGPFFLMLMTSVAHDPFEVPAGFAPPEEDRYQRYLQTVQYTDHFLDQVCAELLRRGWDDNTILCVLGDHGISFRLDDQHGRWIPYEEVIRVPWIIRWPGHLEAGQTVSWPCSQLDVAPTLLNLLGFDVSDAGFDGRDALAPADPDRRLFYSSWYADSPLGFVEGTRKWIYWPYRDTLFLYDLDSDPGEDSAIVVEDPEKNRVVTLINDWQEKSRFYFHPRRFKKRFVYDHWNVFSSGRSAWAYYVP